MGDVIEELIDLHLFRLFYVTSLSSIRFLYIFTGNVRHTGYFLCNIHLLHCNYMNNVRRATKSIYDLIYTI